MHVSPGFVPRIDPKGRLVIRYSREPMAKRTLSPHTLWLKPLVIPVFRKPA